jgi:MHS family proline/betaine transporter-like MFS transporter
LAARLVQGFSTGGEYGNAMTFIAEYAPDRRRGFLGSWLEFGTFCGYLLGAIVVTVADATLSEPQLLSWGWRIPFLVALPLGAIGVYLRFRLADTPAFAALESEAGERERRYREAGGEARELLRLWPFMLVCMGLVLVWNVTNYMLTSYMPTYVTDTVPAARGVTNDPAASHTSQLVQIAVMVVALLCIPLIGLLSDRIGRKPIAWAGSIGLVVLAFPMIALARQQGAVPIFAGLMIMGLLLICFSATMPSTLPSLFPTEVRGAGLCVSFNVSVSLFAGTTSLVVGTLVAATGDLYWPAYYLIGAGLIGGVSLWFLQEPNGRRMWGSPPAATCREDAERLVDAQAAA